MSGARRDEFEEDLERAETARDADYLREQREDRLADHAPAPGVPRPQAASAEPADARRFGRRAG